MFEVINRSEESWGPLAKCDDKTFTKLISELDAKTKIKDHLKKQKKLKKYKVSFIKELVSDEFEIMAESDYDVSSAARQYFKENKDAIDFKMKPVGKWAGEYEGYDRLRYVKARL